MSEIEAAIALKQFFFKRCLRQNFLLKFFRNHIYFQIINYLK